jgi:heptosyltransferase-1
LLIIKMSSIGDVVHALPVAGALRRRHPHARLTWVAESWTAPLLSGHPAIDRIVTLPPMRWSAVGKAWLLAITRAIADLRSEPYDLVLDLQGLFKSGVMAVLSRARQRFTVAGAREGARLLSQPVSPLPGHCHAVDEYLHAAAVLGAAPDPVRFDLNVQAGAAATIHRRLDSLGIGIDLPLVVINPSASVPWKHWPAERWAQVASALAEQCAIVLVGGHEQRRRHGEVYRLATARSHASLGIHDLTGTTALTELVALLARCTVHLAPDTGSAHIAAALGRPVIGLYGPTPPWRQGPYGQLDRVVYREGQCGLGCPRFCPRQRRCLAAIRPDEVIAAARAAIRQSQSEG